MRMKTRVIAAVVLCSFLTVPAVFGHHAGSNYDRDHEITLTGTVTQYEFANPHVSVHFDVKDEKGVVSHWTAQAGPPGRVFREGWGRDSLKPGDTVKVTGLPSKDGAKSMRIQHLVTPSGEVLREGEGE
jgi:hypothetical protein